MQIINLLIIFILTTGIFNFFIRKKINTFDLLLNKKVIIIGKLPQPEINPNNIVENILGIQFNDDCGLTINNPYKLINVSAVEDFIGEKVKSINYNDLSVSFNFTNEKKIIVSIKEEDWDSPEAMVLDCKGIFYIWDWYVKSK